MTLRLTTPDTSEAMKEPIPPNMVSAPTGSRRTGRSRLPRRDVYKRQLQETGTPFAFVSGSAPHEVPATLRDVRFLRKPFSTREIAAFVKSAVGARALKAVRA